VRAASSTVYGGVKRRDVVSGGVPFLPSVAAINGAQDSLQGDVEFAFSLDFDAERIQFDVFNDIGVADTGSVESAERIHEVRRFWQDYFANGQLQIFNADTGELIGRKDAYIPLNMYFDADGAAAELAQWKAVAERRRERDRRYGEALELNAQKYDVTVVLPSR
jgi:hypothetical protein